MDEKEKEKGKGWKFLMFPDSSLSFLTDGQGVTGEWRRTCEKKRKRKKRVCDDFFEHLAKKSGPNVSSLFRLFGWAGMQVFSLDGKKVFVDVVTRGEWEKFIFDAFQSGFFLLFSEYFYSICTDSWIPRLRIFPNQQSSVIFFNAG